MSILLSIALGVLAVGASAFGGILSLRESWQRWAFILSGFFMVVLIVLQVFLNSREQKYRDSKIDDLRGRMAVLVDLVSHSPNKPVEKSPVTALNIRKLTNSELKEKALGICNNMRDFELKHYIQERQRDARSKPLTGTEDQKTKIWKEQVNFDLQKSAEYKNEFRKRYLGDAISYKDELLRRLNMMPPDEERHIVALEGHLAGPVPINELAMYLEKLARQLPE